MYKVIFKPSNEIDAIVIKEKKILSLMYFFDSFELGKLYYKKKKNGEEYFVVYTNVKPTAAWKRLKLNAIIDYYQSNVLAESHLISVFNSMIESVCSGSL